MRRNPGIYSLFMASVLLIVSVRNSQGSQETGAQKELQHEVAVTLKLIQVYVTDKNGNPVTDLTKEDFILWDNGELKTITDFETHFISLPKTGQTPAQVTKTPEKAESLPSPISLNRKFFFLLDYSGNGLYGINKSKIAAQHFIDTKVQPDDEVAVLSLSALRGLVLHEYLTTNYELVRAAIQKMKGVPGGFKGGIGMDAGEGYIESGVVVESSGTAAEEMRHANMNALDTIEILREFARSLRYIPGYKNIIFFSTGFSGSGSEFRYLFEDLCKELASSSAPVHAVWTISEKTIWGGDDLKRLSDQSGGKFFSDVADYESVSQGIHEISGTYYVLGYSIDEKWDGKYNRIKVEVNRKECIVHAQGGYFDPKPFTEYSDFVKQLHLFDLAMSENPQFQVPCILPSIALPCSENEESNLLILTEIPIDKIKEFTKGDTEVLNIIFDEEKNISEYQESEINFYTLPNKNICLYSISSLTPGKYECRLVIRDIRTGKGAVASSSVVIPEASDTGINLVPPLLLIPDKKTAYLKLSMPQEKGKDEESLSINDMFPFLSNKFSPLIHELDQDVLKILAVLRLSMIDIPEHEIEITINLINQSVNEIIPLSNSSILSTKNIEGTEVILIEIKLPELEPGNYSLEINADELTTISRALVTRNFEIK